MSPRPRLMLLALSLLAASMNIFAQTPPSEKLVKIKTKGGAGLLLWPSDIVWNHRVQ